MNCIYFVASRLMIIAIPANLQKPGAMKVSTLRYWLRRIKDADQPEPEQAWATMKLIDKVASADSTPIIIRVNAFEISLHPGFEPAVLATVIRTLQGI